MVPSINLEEDGLLDENRPHSEVVQLIHRQATENCDGDTGSIFTIVGFPSLLVVHEGMTCSEVCEQVCVISILLHNRSSGLGRRI